MPQVSLQKALYILNNMHLNLPLYIVAITLLITTTVSNTFAQQVSTSTVCSNKLFMAVGNNAGKGRWVVLQGSGSFSKQNASATTLRRIGEGANTYAWKSIFKGKRIFEIQNQSVEVKLFSDSEICEPSLNFKIKEKGVGLLRFYLNGLLVDAEKIKDKTYKLTNLPVGENTLVVQKYNGHCTDADTVFVKYTHIEAKTKEFINVDKSSFYLKAVIDYGLTGWWECEDKSVLIGNNKQPITQVKHLKYGQTIFTWNVKSDKCIASVSTTVLYDELLFAGKIEDAAFVVDTASGRLVLPQLEDGSNSLPDSEIWIFNTFGELVYNTSPYRGDFSIYTTNVTDMGIFKAEVGSYYFYFKPDTNSEQVLYNAFVVKP